MIILNHIFDILIIHIYPFISIFLTISLNQSFNRIHFILHCISSPYISITTTPHLHFKHLSHSFYYFLNFWFYFPNFLLQLLIIIYILSNFPFLYLLCHVCKFHPFNHSKFREVHSFQSPSILHKDIIQLINMCCYTCSEHTRSKYLYISLTFMSSIVQTTEHINEWLFTPGHF